MVSVLLECRIEIQFLVSFCGKPFIRLSVILLKSSVTPGEGFWGSRNEGRTKKKNVFA